MELKEFLEKVSSTKPNRDGLTRFEIPRNPSDQNIFTRVFLKVFKLTPEEYQKILEEIRAKGMDLIDEESNPVLLVGLKPNRR